MAGIRFEMNGMCGTKVEEPSANAAGQGGDVRVCLGPFISWRISSRLLRLSRELFWIGLGQAAAVLGALVGVRILTGVLRPEVYGQLALAMTVTMLVNQVALGPLSGTAMRFYSPAKEGGFVASYFAALRGMFVQATGVILIAAVALSSALAVGGWSEWIGLVWAAFGFALLSGYNSVLSGMQNAARQRAVVALHQGVGTWGRFCIAAAMVLWLGESSTVAMLGYILAILVVLGSQGWFFRRTLGGQEGTPHAEQALRSRCRREMFSYAWPFATWGVFTWMQTASGRWSLEFFDSTRNVGHYAVLYQMGYFPMTILSQLTVQLVSPIMFQRAGDASSRQRVDRVYGLNRRLIGLTLGLTVVVFTVVLGLHDRIFRFLVAPEYASAANLLPWMILAGGLFATGQAASLDMMSSLKPRTLVLPKVVTAIVGVVLNVVGAIFYGMRGVVFAAVCFGGVYLVWMLMLTGGKWGFMEHLLRGKTAAGSFSEQESANGLPEDVLSSKGDAV